jgi:branched-chain amino acid transport system permease protein
MRLRPEGIIANRRRQLEFHDDAPAADAPPQADGSVPLGTAGA